MSLAARLAVVGAFLFLATGLVFGRSVRFGFVAFDDGVYVAENPQVAAGMTVEGLKWAFTQRHASNWHPLTWVSHMLDCQLYGLRAGGHHLSSVLLHMVNAVLLLLLLVQMTGRLWPAAFAAVLFAVHPLRVESVAWVAERKDLLSGFFFLLTLMAYVRYARRPPSLVAYLLVAGAYALGLMSKPMLVTLPLVLLLLDYWPLARMNRQAAARLAWEKLSLLALAAASCGATLWAQREAMGSIEHHPLASRLGNAVVAYFAYVRTFFFPQGLAYFYPHPQSTLPSWAAGMAALALLALTAGSLAWRRAQPHLTVGWLWYTGMLVPVIGLVQVGSQSMADRYTYLPQIGLSAAAAWACAGACRAAASRRWAAGAACASSVLMAAIAWYQTGYWRDSETLFTHALATTTNNYVAHNNLGIFLAGRGQLEEAIAHYRRAVAIKPDFLEARNNLGIALADRGQFDEAIAQSRQALAIKPDFAEAHYNLGDTLRDRGRLDEAIAHYRQALAFKPDFPEALNNLGVALAGRGQHAEAIAQYRKALAINPNDWPAYNNLGVVSARQGRLEEAIAHYRRAVALKPDFAEAHYNLGDTLSDSGRLDEAIAHYLQAVAIRPDFLKARNNLGIVLAARGQLDAAIVQYRKVLEINPGDWQACNNLGVALARQGQLEEAIGRYRQALAIKPEFAEARSNLGDTLVKSGQLGEAVKEYRQALDLAARGGPPALEASLRQRLAAHESRAPNIR